jgi:TadE-like protein
MRTCKDRESSNDRKPQPVPALPPFVDMPRSPRPRTLASMRGQSIVEFAVVAVLFFTLLFAMIDFGRMFFIQMTLQNAVRQAGRFAVTGNKLPDPKHPGKNLSRIDSIIATARQSAPGVTIDDIQISSKKGGAGNAGAPLDTVTISITDDLQLVTPIISRFFGKNGVYHFDVSVTFQNEPFAPGNAT